MPDQAREPLYSNSAVTVGWLKMMSAQKILFWFTVILSTSMSKFFTKVNFQFFTRIFCCFFFCCFTSHVNSYGHCGTVSSLNHTFSWAGLSKRLTSNLCTYFRCNWQQPFLNKSAEGRRMTVEIISWSISTKVWYRARIELATPGSAVRHASVARHVTDAATRPGTRIFSFGIIT